MTTTLSAILQALQAPARVLASLPAHHALFGLLLWVLVLLHFSARPKKSISHPDDLRAASKDQSRLVYLLLYLEVSTNILMGLPAENLHDVLGYGLGALALIRALTFVRYKASLRQEASIENPADRNPGSRAA